MCRNIRTGETPKMKSSENHTFSTQVRSKTITRNQKYDQNEDKVKGLSHLTSNQPPHSQCYS